MNWGVLRAIKGCKESVVTDKLSHPKCEGNLWMGLGLSLERRSVVSLNEDCRDCYIEVLLVEFSFLLEKWSSLINSYYSFSSTEFYTEEAATYRRAQIISVMTTKNPFNRVRPWIPSMILTKRMTYRLLQTRLIRNSCTVHHLRPIKTSPEVQFYLKTHLRQRFHLHRQLKKI